MGAYPCVRLGPVQRRFDDYLREIAQMGPKAASEAALARCEDEQARAFITTYADNTPCPHAARAAGAILYEQLRKENELPPVRQVTVRSTLQAAEQQSYEFQIPLGQLEKVLTGVGRIIAEKTDERTAIYEVPNIAKAAFYLAYRQLQQRN